MHPTAEPLPTSTRPADAAPEDALQPITRLGLAVLLLLTIPNGLFCYLLPARAEDDHVWAIAPPISAAFMGAGFLSGIVATAIGAVLARRWGTVRLAVPAFLALSTTVLTATLVHEEKFRWDYPFTWLWTGVYAGVIPGAILLWRLQERSAARPPDRLWSPPVAAVAYALGAALAVVGLVLFFLPDTAIDVWPWQLTPLVSRVLGAWYLLNAAMLVFSAFAVRAPHELPATVGTTAAWSALLLPLPALEPATVDSGSPELVAWLVLHAAVLVFCAWTVARAVVDMRAAGQRM